MCRPDWINLSEEWKLRKTQWKRERPQNKHTLQNTRYLAEYLMQGITVG